MSQEMMNTKEVAEYLGVHEKQVYVLIKAQRIPATRVTGKWVFPKHLIDEWIASNASKGLAEARQKSRRVEGALLCAGSNDVALDSLFSNMREAYPEFYFFSVVTGSADGLKALNMGYTDVAWSHLLHFETGEYNIPYLPIYVPDIKPVVVNLYHRNVGFVTAPGNPLGITGFDDFARKDVRIINRQEGAGIRVLIDHNLKRRGISPAQVRGYENKVWKHMEIGLSVLSKEADVGIVTGAVASILGLDFIPFTEERFDMVLAEPTFFSKPIQAILSIIRSKSFQKRIGKMGNYQFHESGKILYP